MTYLSKEQFAHLLKTENHDSIVRAHIFGGTPFVFRDRPEDSELLFQHLSGKLRIRRDDWTIIGSAKTGFSVAPEKYGQPFRAESDIDVVIVSENLFDAIWLDLLRFPRYRLRQLRDSDQDRVRRHEYEVYWGRVWPHQLLSVSSKAVGWIDAFRSTSQIPQLAYHEIRGRLYRTWEHAHIYHLYGLRHLARRLESTQ